MTPEELEIERLQAKLASALRAFQVVVEAQGEQFKLREQREKELEQAKDAVQKQAAFYNVKVLEIEGQAKERILTVERELAAAIVARDLNHEQWKLVNKEWGQAKEREMQLRQDLSQPNPNVFVPNTTTDGTGNSEAFRELASICRIRELEAANARLREALTRILNIENKVYTDPVHRMRNIAEAALTVPPARNDVEMTQAINKEINRQMSVDICPATDGYKIHGCGLNVGHEGPHFCYRTDCRYEWMDAPTVKERS